MTRAKTLSPLSPFVQEVVAAIRARRKHTTFTTDQLWANVLLDRGRDPRAMGSAIRVAEQRGLIEFTGGYRRSMRAVCHRRPVAVWKRI